MCAAELLWLINLLEFGVFAMNKASVSRRDNPTGAMELDHVINKRWY